MPSATDPLPKFTPTSDFPNIVNELRSGFHAGNIRSYEARDFQLRKFLALLKDNQDRLVKAVVADLKCPSDALLEFKYLVSETCHAIRNLKEWMNPTHVHKTIAYKFDDCYTRPDPLGIVLIIGAWNYPLTVLLEPFIGALSAGNCVVLKPSEVSSNTAIILAELIPKYMDTKMVRLVNTDGPGTRALMDLKWDHVFFTGSSKIGTLIYEEAAKQLTPVTLELGGKSPCIVADDSDIQIVATRIAWGKFMNAGQTCIAPDYILCSENVIDRLIEGLKVAVQAFYGSPEIGGEKSYGKIINDKHMNRLVKLINDNEETKIPLAPQWDKVSMDERIIPPYVFKGVVPENSSLMKEEIFGPLLPIISVPSIDQAIDYIRCHDKPLALYLFTNDKLVIDKVLSGTSSGGVCINDTFMHSLLNTLPFGGVGPSGLGRYHGKHSFDTFSHTKSVQWTGQSGEWLNTPRYPPLTFNKLKVLESLLFTNSP